MKKGGKYLVHVSTTSQFRVSSIRVTDKSKVKSSTSLSMLKNTAT